tara:strand:+ start:990 stop:1412 length:423 start_codon:yes stop_codon:yes gene_type:complete
MASINKAILIGRVGKQPEKKQDNAPVNLSLATHEVWRDKQGAKHEDLQWHRVVVWGAQADNVMKYVNVGDMLYIEGKLQTDTYEKDGHKMYTTKIVAREIKFLTPKGGGQPQQQQQSKPQQPPEPQHQQAFIPNYDDIPF